MITINGVYYGRDRGLGWTAGSGAVAVVMTLAAASQGAGTFGEASVVIITLVGVVAIVCGAGTGITVLRGLQIPRWFGRLRMFRALALAGLFLAAGGLLTAGALRPAVGPTTVTAMAALSVCYQLAAGTIAGFGFILSSAGRRRGRQPGDWGLSADSRPSSVRSASAARYGIYDPRGVSSGWRPQRFLAHTAHTRARPTMERTFLPLQPGR